MKATLPDESVFNGRNYCGDKELIHTLNAVCLHVSSGAPELRTVVTVRVHGTKARNYVSIWVNASERNGHSYCGHGWAGGYGYHRPSAALQVALKSAGITLDADIDGRGESAMRDAVRAICAALGYTTVHLVEN